MDAHKHKLVKKALGYSETCRRTRLYYETFQDLYRLGVMLECKIDDTNDWLNKVYLFEPWANTGGGIRYRVKL